MERDAIKIIKNRLDKNPSLKEAYLKEKFTLIFNIPPVMEEFSSFVDWNSSQILIPDPSEG